jgi:ribosomal protein L17
MKPENKDKFESLKHEFFELIEAFNMKNKSHIKLTWKENDPKIKFEEKFESSLLKDKIETTRFYAKKSDQFVPSMVNNVKWNTFLRSPAKLEFLTQSQNTISKILSYLENNQKEIIYHQNNIVTLVNLQIPLCNDKFQNLSKQIKLRVICMLFAKYVNRKTLSYICQDFLENIDITNNSQIRQNILK